MSDASTPVTPTRKKTSLIRLAIVCAVLLSAGIVTGTGLFLSSLHHHIRVENERNLSNIALILEEHVEMIFATAERVQKHIIDQTAAFGIIDPAEREHQLSKHDFHLKLRDLAAGMRYVGSLTFINAQGRVINFSRQWPIPDISTADRDFFKVFQADPNLTSFVGEPIRNRATGTRVVQFARKISGPNKEFVGLITAAIELEALQKTLDEIALEPDSGIALFHQDGTLMARVPRNDSDIGRRFPNAYFHKLVSTADRGVGVGLAGIVGDVRMIAAQRVSGYPIVVAAGKSVAAIFADWRRTAAYVIGVSILSIATIAAFVLLFIKQLKNYQALIEARAAQEKAEQLRKLSLRFHVAANNMSQGLLMFDAAAQIVVCNERYIEMYRLSPEVVRPGQPLLDLVKHRAETGTFSGDPEAYCSEILGNVAKGQTTSEQVETADGRTIHIVNKPMPGGGWVVTHEDVTEAKQREASFRLLFDENPVPMWIIDRGSGRFLAVNDAAVTHYGYSREAFLAMNTLDIRPAEQHERFIQQVLLTNAVGNMQREWKHLTADGRMIDVVAYSRALKHEGHDARVVAIHDITEPKRAEDELRRTKKFLNTVIENVPIPILVKDVPRFATDPRDFRFSLVNRAYEALMGISRDQVIGKTTHELYQRDLADAIVERDLETLRSDRPVDVFEHDLVTPGNGTRRVTAMKVAIRDKDERHQHLLTVLDDVTERRRAEEHIWHLAHNDSLTKLPNRSAFLEHFAAVLNQAADTDERFSVLCIDLDRFKEVNDDFGHLVGDGLLYEAACRLKEAAAGAFLARVGGDEFTLIVTGDSQPAAAEAICERMFAAFKDEFVVDGHRLQLGLSIGGAVYPADGADVKTLMTNADAALYRAKAEVRGHAWFFEAELGNRLRERRDLPHDLQFAIQRGELFLHYQPQKKLASGKIVGFESLARWQCPKRGAVAPDTFIPVAEESGLIIPLGEWVLREACREAASWPRPLKIAVNISPIQFRQGDLPNLVHSILLETGLAPARLELEITEGVLIDDFSLAVSILRKLKSLGVQIAMDDFGSGYSSLSYLHSFPFDKIKIDRSFIGDLEYNQQSKAIVRAIITLGHSLEVPILAEGLETEAQRVFLAQEGCDEVQGYLTGRPLPIEDYAGLVRRPTTAKQIHLAAAR